jgi:hypothetical protein
MSRGASQRSVMRSYFHRFGGDRERTVAAYAAAERRGEVARRSNVRAMDPDDYARRLFADGARRGWIR